MQRIPNCEKYLLSFKNVKIYNLTSKMKETVKKRNMTMVT